MQSRAWVCVGTVAFVLAWGLACGGESSEDDSNAIGMAGAAGAGVSGAAGTASGANASGTGGIAGANVAGASGAAGAVSAGASGMLAAGAGGAAAGEGASGGASEACTITSTLTMSPEISTVGSLEITTDLAGMDAAVIELGLDTDYGTTIPVDLEAPSYRTLLLGMKPQREYHYRVVAMAGATRCVGEDNLLTTGDPPNRPRLPPLTIETPQPDKLASGFIVSGIFMSGPAFIIDKDGDYVWWFDSGDTTSVRMSYDGKHMWMRNSNVMGGESLVQRVSMDGTEVERFDLSSEFQDGHHDFAVLPDESLLLIVHDPTGCDKIVERSPDGTARDVLNASDAHGGNSCHVNSIHYHADDDTLTFSDLNQNCYVKARRATGEVLWVMGGPANEFTGDGVEWDRQHGHHMLASGHMLMFENGSVGQSSRVYELMLDEDAKTAMRLWEYSSSGLSTFVMGDVQRLSNANTLVTYTTAGTIHEVDEAMSLVRSIEFGLGGAVGYVEYRDSLYGPPPR